MDKLEIDGVTLMFSGRTILNDIYLQCKTTEIVGILGRNGTGKSCLMKMIFGSMKGEHQSVRINGEYHAQAFTVPNNIHFMPQDGFVFGRHTFQDLISIFELHPYLDEIYTIPEIQKNKGQKLKDLSHGMRKVMQILTVLYTPGKFAILDEPFSHLSPVMIERIIPHIQAQSKAKGIILSDHLYETVFKVSTHLYVLSSCVLHAIEHEEDLGRFGYVKG